ncbi:MAG TPA: molybdate ABC transporter substrate-binding protein [Cytophagales bacterium]|nr:molybdate ABC transporter substrate-binding protein [Cytophagales bacterium]
MKQLLLFSFLLFSSSFLNKTCAQKLTVAVSSNAQYVLEELITEFKKQHNVQIDLIIGSSGKLTQQIIQGAPFDIFFSADLEYPMELNKKGLTKGDPKVYAHGILILWTTKDMKLSKQLEFLKASSIKKIALGNPQFSPYGKETIEILQKSGIYEEITSKIIQGESLSQVNQYIYSGICDLGFTSKSVVMTKKIKPKGNWLELDPATYNPIPQAAVILKRGNKKTELLSAEFLDFTLSSKGREILKKNGYNLKDLSVEK